MTQVYWMIGMYQRHDIPAASAPPPELVVPRAPSMDPVADMLMPDWRPCLSGVQDVPRQILNLTPPPLRPSSIDPGSSTLMQDHYPALQQCTLRVPSSCCQACAYLVVNQESACQCFWAFDPPFRQT